MSRSWGIKTGVGLIALIGLAAGAIACGGSSKKDEATAQPAAAQSPAASGKLFIDLDTVRGSTGIPTEQRTAKSCVQSNKIPRRRTGRLADQGRRPSHRRGNG